jgi:hypothetical protein
MESHSIWVCPLSKNFCSIVSKLPEFWRDTIITMARKKHPYIVVPLRFNQFYDLQKVAKENYGSFKQTTDGEKVNWGKIKIIEIGLLSIYF